MKDSLILKLLLIIFLLHGCKHKTEMVTPKKADITESVYASGIVKSENQYDVFTKINSRVEKLFVKEGDFVKKGQSLLQLESINAKLSTANAQNTAIANDYAQNKEKLIDAQNAIELARKKLSNDSLLLTRQQELWSQNIGSKIELEQKELSFENAKVNLKKAEVNYNEISRQLKLTSNQSNNNLKIAQYNENDLIIRSEVEGYIYKINLKQGELATTMNPIAIVGEKKFVIEFNVDEFDIVKIQKGQKVIIRMDSYQKEIFEAQVSFIYPMMEEQTRTFRVEAIFTKEPKILFPNLTLEANIIINEKKNALTIPTNYLINESTVILEDGSEKKVEIGLKDYTLTEILGGIDENTKIRMPEK